MEKGTGLLQLPDGSHSEAVPCLTNVGIIPKLNPEQVERALEDSRPLTDVTLELDSESGEVIATDDSIDVCKLWLNVCEPGCTDLPMVSGEEFLSEKAIIVTILYAIQQFGAHCALDCQPGDKVHAIVPQLPPPASFVRKEATCWISKSMWILQTKDSEVTGQDTKELHTHLSTLGTNVLYVMKGTIAVEGCEVISMCGWSPKYSLSENELEETIDANLPPVEFFEAVAKYCRYFMIPTLLVSGKQPDPVSVLPGLASPMCDAIAYLLCAVFGKDNHRTASRKHAAVKGDGMRMIANVLMEASERGIQTTKNGRVVTDALIGVATKGHHAIWKKQYGPKPQQFPGFVAEPTPEFETMIKKAMAAANERKRFAETSDCCEKFNETFSQMKKARTLDSMLHYYSS